MLAEQLFRASGGKLLKKVLRKRLKTAGYSISKKTWGKEFLYAAGDIPLLLVAHVDTVHCAPPQIIYHDRERNVMWSPDGLGADDRAGVWAILSIINKGFRPHVLFTDGEETGGTGAWEAVGKLKVPAVNAIIELDRKNSNESVFYNLDNPEFKRWVNGFGYKTVIGSFSDISILCPEWGIAGVNLSIGYYNAHTNSEYLKVDEMKKTINRVVHMLKSPPSAVFEYKEKESVIKNTTTWGWADTPSIHGYASSATRNSRLSGLTEDYPMACEYCGKFERADELLSFGNELVCGSCMRLIEKEIEAEGSIIHCDCCGEPEHIDELLSFEDEFLCFTCFGERKKESEARIS
ncbi:MAG: hypothetical protein LRZ94_01220 [Candidatus Pacebacteria bacterium]|nr:hypothetical protein [Candidatus Paceibacterota bacterium]